MVAAEVAAAEAEVAAARAEVEALRRAVDDEEVVAVEEPEPEVVVPVASGARAAYDPVAFNSTSMRRGDGATLAHERGAEQPEPNRRPRRP